MNCSTTSSTLSFTDVASLTYNDIDRIPLSLNDAKTIVRQIEYYFDDASLNNPNDYTRNYILGSNHHHSSSDNHTSTTSSTNNDEGTTTYQKAGFVPFSILATYKRLAPFIAQHPLTLIKAFFIYPSTSLTLSPDNHSIGRLVPYTDPSLSSSASSSSAASPSNEETITFRREARVLGLLKRYFSTTTLDNPTDQIGQILRRYGKILIDIVLNYPSIVSVFEKKDNNNTVQFLMILRKYANASYCPVIISNDELYLLPKNTVPLLTNTITDSNHDNVTKENKLLSPDSSSPSPNRPLLSVIELLRCVCDVSFISLDNELQQLFLTTGNTCSTPPPPVFYRYRQPIPSSSSTTFAMNDTEQYTNLTDLPDIYSLFVYITTRYNDQNTGIQYLPAVIDCLGSLSLVDLITMIPDIYSYFVTNTVITPSGTRLHLLQDAQTTVNPSVNTTITQPVIRYRVWLENIFPNAKDGAPCIREICSSTNPSVAGYSTATTIKPFTSTIFPASSGMITMMSYNVLGPFTTYNQYQYTEPQHLTWKYRRGKLIQEIAYYRPTIIAMQELSTVIYNVTGWDTPLPVDKLENDPACWVRKIMLKLGYDGIYLRHGQDPRSAELAAAYTRQVQQSEGTNQQHQHHHKQPVLPPFESFPPEDHNGDWNYTVKISNSNYTQIHHQIKQSIAKSKELSSSSSSNSTPIIQSRETLGIALFWRIDTLEPLITQRIPYSAIFLERLGHASDPKSIATCYDLIARDKGCLLGSFRVRDTGQIFIGGCTHISCAFTQPWYQMMESQALTFATHRLATLINPDQPTKVPFILGGDFNATPDKSVHQFLVTGKTSVKDWNLNLRSGSSSNNSNTKDEIIFQPQHIHHLPFGLSLPGYGQLHSAYRTVLQGNEPPYTNFVYRLMDESEAESFNPSLSHHGLPYRRLPVRDNDDNVSLLPFRPFMETLDYLFYNSSSVQPLHILLPPNVSTILHQGTAGACPNHHFPSDHVSILASFTFI